MKKYDTAVFIGRFQPLHIGHQHVIDEALKLAERVLVLIGSAETARSVKNPFTFEEREHMLRAVYRRECANGNLVLKPLRDIVYNDAAWAAQVQRAVDGLDRQHEVTETGKTALVGYRKDGSGYYLKMFPQWDAVEIPAQHGIFNATDLREGLFSQRPAVLPWDSCDSRVVDWLKEFRLTPDYKQVWGEAQFINDHRRAWGLSPNKPVTPYEPVFVTVDAVCIQSGHILLVRRGQHPGRGLLAIPGGYLNPRENIIDAAVRELREETKIADDRDTIPAARLKGFIEGEARVFADPDRSSRGRVITHAFLFRFPDSKPMFKVKGSDDAAHAHWYKLGDLKQREFFEDHYSILEEMIGI